MRSFFIILYVMMAMAVAMPCVASSPKFEMRGAWLVTAYGLDWPSCQGVTRQVAAKQKAELDTLLSNLHRAGINAVFFQVRPMADAFYASSYEPWSGYLTGTRGVEAPYDPLGHCIDYCHALGMECHAWINPFRVGTRTPATTLDRRNSHLWMANRVGKSSMIIFNPALDETRRHLCDICREIATNYDIDGIVFDDYFYNPEFIPEDERAADWKCYLEAADAGQNMADWRRANINRAIADVSALLATIKDGKIRFGVSPQGIGGANGVYASEGVPALTSYGILTADSQYDKIYSDPVNWLKEGLIDYISPQIYWTTDNRRHPYGALSRWWNDVAEMFGRHCFPSQTITALAKTNLPQVWSETFSQVRHNREASFNGAPGSVLYSARFIGGRTSQGFGKALRDSVFASRALVPPMRWKSGATPVEVDDLAINKSGLLTWRSSAPDARYVVYAIPAEVDDDEVRSADSDGIDASFILAVTYSNSYVLPARYRTDYRIAVTPFDRYGIEWQPAYLIP